MQQIGRVLRPHPGKVGAVILDHAGNCVRFGLPHQFQVPDLSTDDKDRGRAKRDTTKLVPCSGCGYLLEPGQRKCPGCGFDRPVRTADVVRVDGELVEYGTPEEIQARNIETKQNWYQAFKWIAEVRDYHPGWAYHAYKSKFDDEEPPWSWRDLPPVEPSDEQARYVKYLQIRAAKSRR
jgi:DNA repair protein RadD